MESKNEDANASTTREDTSLDEGLGVPEPGDPTPAGADPAPPPDNPEVDPPT